MSNFHEGLATAILIEILLKKCNNKSVTPCLVVGVVKGVGFLRVGRGELGVTVGGLVGVVYRVFQ